MTAKAPYPEFDGTQACADADPELFFPRTGSHPDDTAKAVAICAGCPFRESCAAYALTHKVFGIWGGTTLSTREAVQRKHRIDPVVLELSDTHTRIEEVRRLTANGLSAAEIADRTVLAKRSATRIRGYESS